MCLSQSIYLTLEDRTDERVASGSFVERANQSFDHRLVDPRPRDDIVDDLATLQ